ncbi:MAG: T9SS type A sorting domain-containing protein [Bacteroidetes bacterium]|nr:T9SS type A sorting domain-containing protein [Bacteroidota bacterium]
MLLVTAALTALLLILTTLDLASQVIEEKKPSLPSMWRTELPSYGARTAELGPDGAYVFVFDEGKLRRLRGDNGAVDWSEDFVFFGLGGFVENRQIAMLKTTPYFIICGDVVDTNGDYYSLLQLRRYPSGQLVREQLFPSFIQGNAVISDNDKYMAVTRNGYYTVFNVLTGDTVWSHPKIIPTSIASCWTRDSTRLLIGQALEGNNHMMLACWDIEKNVEIWNRSLPGNEIASEMSVDGKRILFHSLPRNGAGDYTLLDFPSLNVVSTTASTGLSSNCMLASPDANFAIVTARSTKNGERQNMALFEMQSGIDREIDSVDGLLSSRIIENSFVRYGSRFVQRLRFDWATDVGSTVDRAAEPGLIPNPCQSVSTIQYEVPTEQHVKVSLYDTQGNLVDVLVDGLQVGNQLLHIDCTSFANGVYFCEIEIGKERRVVLAGVLAGGGAK